MATYKSDIVAAYDSGDKLADRKVHKSGRITALLDLTGAITTSDVALMCRINPDCTISSIKIWSDDLGTTGDFNIGFHRVGAGNTAGAVIDADALATAVDVNAAALAGTELRFETLDLETINTKVRDLNPTLTADTAAQEDGEWFLTITPSEDTTAAGEVVLVIDTHQ